MLKHSRLSRVSSKREFFNKRAYLSKLSPFVFLGITLLGGLYFESQNMNVFNPRADIDLINPVAQAYAMEVVVATPEPTVLPTPMTQKEEIEAYIVEVFGKDAKSAKIVAECESKLKPQAVGDTNLMVNYQGEVVGDSIGVFQIRTGGKNFNRAKANGMTADEFRTYLKDYKNNVDYAKKIFDKQGWGPWTCKKDLK